MTLRTPPPTSGSPDQFPVLWESFVRLVLEITVEAYQHMRRDGVARQDWEEDTFTASLTEDYIRPLARQHPLSLVAEPRAKVHTPAMKSGAVSPKRATEIDIKLFRPWMNYSEVYFAWECKRVGDKSVDAKYGILISRYITERILRFIDEDYAAGLYDAGMLGYVLAGDVTNIVHDINTSMQDSRRKRPLPSSEHLVSAPAVGTFTDAYQSRHQQSVNHKTIRLHHLFLTFDFDIVDHCPTAS